MDEIKDLLERTQWLQDQVAGLQTKINEVRNALDAHAALLAAKLSTHNTKNESSDAGSANPVAGSPVDSPEQEPDAASSPQLLSQGERGSGEESNRRAIPRHRGRPVSVLMTEEPGTSPAFHGWVTDRSPDGLCVISDKEQSVGARLKIQPALACSEWFPIEVKSCRQERKGWVLGCRFRERLSWNRLRLFS